MVTMVVCACQPRARLVGVRGSLGLTGQPNGISEPQVPVRDPDLKDKVAITQGRTPKGVPWSPEVCMYTPAKWVSVQVCEGVPTQE